MIDCLDVPRWTTLTNLRRGDIALAPNESESGRHPGTGQPRLFTHRRVIHLALTYAIARSGFRVRDASRLALAFTDESEGTGGWVVEPSTDQPRVPGRLYPDDSTVLVITVPRSGAAYASVKRLTQFQAAPFGPQDATEVVTVIHVDAICERVAAALGLSLEALR